MNGALRALRVLALVACGTGVTAATAATAEAQSPAPVTRDDTLRAAARRIIADAGHAGFITLDSAGQPQARTVQPAAPDSAFIVWFATNPRTRKVAQIDRNARASLYYFDPASLGYVTLVGRARVVRDPREKAAHWQPAWSAFYPERDSSVVLVELIPERLEVVDIKRRITGDARTWHPPTLPLRTPPRPPTPR